MKVEAAKIASTSSKSAFSLVLPPRQRKSDLLEVEVLQYSTGTAQRSLSVDLRRTKKIPTVFIVKITFFSSQSRWDMEPVEPVVVG